MEDIKKRKLTIRLSRLTQQETSTYASTSSTSSAKHKTKQIDLSRLSHVHRAAIAKKRKKRALANSSGGGFKSSSGHVKIKMNFFKKRVPRVIEIPEIKAESKSDSGTSSSSVTAASVTPVVPVVKVAASEAEGPSLAKPKPIEPGHSSSSEVDDTEEKDDSSWADEYEFRPRRAAAAAALEAVQGKKKTENNGDSDLSKFRLRSKFPMKQPLPRAKGRSRRTFWKRAAAQKIQHYRHKPRVTTCKSLFHNNAYFQRGDIVSITGEDDETYFCQIGGLIVDQLHRSYASLSWLVPKENVPCLPFVPRNYAIRDELQPMMTPMEDLEFVMHCPHDYYYDHDINFTKLNPDGPTVYCRFGDPLVTVEDVPIVKKPPVEVQGGQGTETASASAVQIPS